MAKDRNFFIGKRYDPVAKNMSAEEVFYDPADLTTHMFVTGMTGSGKTGLCVTIMEEAAMKGIPAIIIDPKGDLTNLLLHFPDLLPADFEPWIDPEAARREQKSTEAMAAETAELWKNGLASWDIHEDDLRDLKESAQFGIYTPGSTSGIPVNILSSFAAPDLDWQENQEVLRERIASSVTALLGLIGYRDIDPLSSREHILLANIMEYFWSQGKSFDLTDLILQTQSPPFERLGAFPIDRLFPEKERFELAMKLNNFLASPSFQTWLQGQTLNIEELLYMPGGKPRHSIFYLAHLSEDERMFFVTLLYGAVESWMRRQSGTSGLRALVYFDEILGYLPPIGNPPSRTVMLRMLKQARAFGVGMILTSQNPVDLDYKALSNAGTWMIGRLQTDQDKERLMDGLQNASGSIDRKTADQMLSNIGKRVFLLHNIHEKGLVLFHTRWAMNYLAGPMTRTQLPALNELADASLETQQRTETKAAAPAGAGAVVVGESKDLLSDKRPVIPSGIQEYFLPNNLTLESSAKAFERTLQPSAKLLGIRYRANLLAQAEVRYSQRKYNLQTMKKHSVLVEDDEGRLIRWEEHTCEPLESKDLGQRPLPQAGFHALPTWMSDAKSFKALESDFEDWVYREGAVKVHANESLKLYAGPELSTADFRQQCSKAAREQLDEALEKLRDTYERKLDAMEEKLEKEKRDVKTAETKLEQRRMEELGSHGELLLSFLSSRKKSISSSLTKRRMTAQAKANLEEEELDVEQAQKNLDDLVAESEKEIKSLEEEWADKANDISEIAVTPYKKDIFMAQFGIAWLPYYRVDDGGREIELPGFEG